LNKKSKNPAPTNERESIISKIFPRNLTANADYMIRGNPVNSRLEKGVSNCYPGLEFDHRNLENHFFPNLEFELHMDSGVPLLKIIPNQDLVLQRLSKIENLSFYLTGLIGNTEPEHRDDENISSSFPIVDLSRAYGKPFPQLFTSGTGLEVWRRIHALLPGRVAILLTIRKTNLNTFRVFGYDDWRTRLVRGRSETRNVIYAIDPQGKIVPVFGSETEALKDDDIKAAILVANRSSYITDEGVIDPDSYPPGYLTKTLCSPWQYDFRDCGCFYWASNKPDLVSSSDGKSKYLNFTRKNNQELTDDISTYLGWTRNEYNHSQIFKNWNNLPVVLNDREEGDQRISEEEDYNMSKNQIIELLRYLATVEHALCLEYLYAHYTLRAPMQLKGGESKDEKKIFAAANEIFRIAVDEMRHFRWVNEALNLLGEREPSLGRADIIGRPTPSKGLQECFKLMPLTPKQLQWFIDVEAPSQNITSDPDQIDGMYVRILGSIKYLEREVSQPERLIQLIKLIIDEGGDHFRRFSSVKNHLKDFLQQYTTNPDVYLRDLKDPPEGSDEAKLQLLSDENYHLLLDSLELSFSLGDRAGGKLREQSIRAMINLHEVNHNLANKYAQIKFTKHPTIQVHPYDEGEGMLLLEGLQKQQFNFILKLNDINSKISKTIDRYMHVATLANSMKNLDDKDMVVRHCAFATVLTNSMRKLTEDNI
jgi:hypothetical protein